MLWHSSFPLWFELTKTPAMQVDLVASLSTETQILPRISVSTNDSGSSTGLIPKKPSN